jgi:hypothetical protein
MCRSKRLPALSRVKPLYGRTGHGQYGALTFGVEITAGQLEVAQMT